MWLWLWLVELCSGIDVAMLELCWFAALALPPARPAFARFS